MTGGDDEYQTRDVFAEFGLAIYLAQMLEKSVLTAITFAQALEKGDRTAVGFNSAWKNQWNNRRGRTLGQLLKEFATAVRAEPSLVSDLQEALATRNSLAHHFFWDRSADALSVTGRQSVRIELLEVQRQLNDLSDRVTEAVIDMVVAEGGSRALLLGRVRRLFEEAVADGLTRDDRSQEAGN